LYTFLDLDSARFLSFPTLKVIVRSLGHGGFFAVVQVLQVMFCDQLGFSGLLAQLTDMEGLTKEDYLTQFGALRTKVVASRFSLRRYPSAYCSQLGRLLHRSD